MRAASMRGARTILAGALIAFGAFAVGAAPGGNGKGNDKSNEKAGKKNERPDALLIVNGKIHTMDGTDRIVNEVLVMNGRFVEMGKNIAAQRQGAGSSTSAAAPSSPASSMRTTTSCWSATGPAGTRGMEHVFTIPDAVARYQARAATVPAGEFVTTIGPIAAMQFPEQRLPNLSELDAVTRPVYIQAAQGGVRTNSAGKAWLAGAGVTVADDGTIAGGATGTTLALRCCASSC